MARLLVVSRSMALALRLADAHDVLELAVDELDGLLPGPDIDAVVLDVGEPTLAISTLDRLRGSGNTTPLLIVSGYQPAWEGLAAVDIPGVVVVRLPITRAALLEGIDVLVNEGTTPALPARAVARPAEDAAEAVVVDSRLGPELPAEPVRLEGGTHARSTARDEPVEEDPHGLIRPFILPIPPAEVRATGEAWAAPGFDWWEQTSASLQGSAGALGDSVDGEYANDEAEDDGLPGGGCGAEGGRGWDNSDSPITRPTPVQPGGRGRPRPRPSMPTAPAVPVDDPEEPPSRPLRRGWPPTGGLAGPVLLPMDWDETTHQFLGDLPDDPDAPTADDLFPPFTARHVRESAPTVTGQAEPLEPGGAALTVASELLMAQRRALLGRSAPDATAVSAFRRRLGARKYTTSLGPGGTSPELVALGLGGALDDDLGLDTGSDGEDFAVGWAQQPVTPPVPQGGSAPTAAGADVPTASPAAAVPSPARQRLVAQLVMSLTDRVTDLLSVADTAHLIAERLIEIGSAAAAAVLVPDGGLWRISGGVGLRPVERRLVLAATHWLIEQVAAQGQALTLENTENADVVRQYLAGAPLAAWRYLLAAPVPQVPAVVVLARGGEAQPFGPAELAALNSALDAAAELLEAALRARHLARLLAPLREVDQPQT